MSRDIEVSVPDPSALKSKTDGACMLADQITSITTVELYAQGGAALKAIKAAQGNLSAMKEELLNPLSEAVRRIKKLFKGPEDRLERAENFLKGQMIAFEDEQKDLARKEQARLDDIARKEREKKQHQGHEAAAKAREAEMSGDHAKAERLQAKADLLYDTSANIVAPIVIREPPRVAGVVSRETWSATVTDMNALVLSVAGMLCADMTDAEIIAHMRKFRQTPLQALKPDTTFLNAQARALRVKGQIYPGVFGVVNRGIAASGE